MIASNLGLPKTYNRFHDRADRAPDIQRLRDLHHEFDLAVLRAFGWDDLAERAARVPVRSERAGPSLPEAPVLACPLPRQGLTRLLAENEARAARERALGLAPPPAEPDEDMAP